MSSEQDAYNELQAYTLAKGDLDFIHQHVVDAWAAQHADVHTKPIALTFALVGLYLHLQRGFSGRQVQRAHMMLANRGKNWPRFRLPEDRGAVSAVDVMATQAGAERDRAIDDWCSAVWAAFEGSHQEVANLLRRHGIE